MNLITLKQPAWTAALWMLLLNRCNDGPTNAAAAAAAAFAPDYQRQHSATAQTSRPTTTDTTSSRSSSSSSSSSSRKRLRRLDYFGLPSDHHNENQRIFHDDKAFVLQSTATDCAAEETESVVSSITKVHLPHHNKQAWAQLVPPMSLMIDSSSACDDSRIEWGPEDDGDDGDLEEAARKLLEPFAITHDHKEMVAYLADCMKTYQSFCMDHLTVDEEATDAIQGFRARIVCTRGTSGTKCPKWHIDHVPVRWIQSLVGPGCDYLESSKASLEEWQHIKELLENDEHDKLFQMPSASSGKSPFQQHQADEEQAVLLAGHRWNEFTKQPQPFVPPVLHKSPNIPFWQGRVLLTMDVIAPHHFD